MSLIEAARYGNNEDVRMLLGKGADIEAVNSVSHLYKSYCVLKIMGAPAVSCIVC